MKKIGRREFVKLTASSMLAASMASPSRAADMEERPVSITAREYLSKILYTREEVDDWFNGKAFPFSKHDPELGWLLPDARFADGVDGSVSTYRYETDNGPRKVINYADQPCRINTYGDSFTQCHQVSDGETWQEALAAHFCEPVRNFGIGGWSVYQAYLRMLREEARTPAEFLILNIYDDDHYRNLDSWRNIRVRKHPQHIEATLPHLVVDLENKTCEERPNPCPTRESYYSLCELDWVVERFEDDFVLGIMLAHANAKGGNPDAAYKTIQNLATTHGINTRIDAENHVDEAAQQVFTDAALFSTVYIVEKVEAFARAHGKQVLYVLSYPPKRIAQRINEEVRFDQPFVDFLNEKNLAVVDLMEAHVADYAQFSIPVDEYLKRYYIGHYNPWGNLFTAFAIKDQLVEMLEPKPHAYRPL